MKSIKTVLFALHFVEANEDFPVNNFHSWAGAPVYANLHAGVFVFTATPRFYIKNTITKN